MLSAAEEWPSAVERLLGLKSVAVMTVNDHLNMRKLVAPAFTPQALARGDPRLVQKFVLKAVSRPINTC